MAYTFFRAMGGTTGSSLCEEDKLDLANEILKKAEDKGVKIHLPLILLLPMHFSNEANHKITVVG